MHKITKQIFKGHKTDIISILMSFFLFSFKTAFLCWFQYLFYILVLYSVFGKHKLGSSIIDQIGKTACIAEFLTVANTLVFIKNLALHNLAFNLHYTTDKYFMKELVQIFCESNHQSNLIYCFWSKMK